MIHFALPLRSLDLPPASAINSVLSICLVMFALSILLLKPRDVLARHLTYLIIVAAIAEQVLGLALGGGGASARLVYICALGLVAPAFLAFCYRLIEAFG